MIDCAAFEAIVDRLLAGELSPDEERAADRHAVRCDRCSQLLSIARGDLDLLDLATENDLTAGILDRTSGSPCARAELLLCDRVDGAMPEADSELLDLHLDHCADCAELAAALTSLRADLPEMAEIEPDAWFVRDVLDATTRLEPRGIADPALAAARLLGSWSRRLLDRPRLALELAYSGAMIIFLLWGTPVSPLRGTAERALAVMRADPTQGIAGAYRSGSYLAGRASFVTREAWDHAGLPLYHGVQGFWLDVRREGAKGFAVLSTADRYAGSISRAIWRGDLVEAGRVLAEAMKESEARRERPAGDFDVKSDRTPGGHAP
jgi:hypothetical protein